MSSYTGGLTELEDLQLFIQERVAEVDVNIDTTVGSRFDTEVIQPLLERLGPDPYNTPIREFIIARLQSQFPELVLQDGEPVDDYAIKIMQILLEPFRRQVRHVSTGQSFAQPETLNEREADNLGGNFFIRRNIGGLSVGVARIYYSSPQYALITPSNDVYDGSGHRFYPVENQAIRSDNMLFNVENNLYFFDIVVRAEQEGREYNIEPNTLVGISGAPNVVKVTNKAKFEEGEAKETTEEFIERSENSLTEKSLVTFRGISARLRDVFENIRIMQVIGHGDIEMARDIIKGQSETTPYTFPMLDFTSGSREVDLDTGVSYPIIDSSGVSYTSFLTAGIQPGDILEFVEPTATELYNRYVIETVVSATKVLIETAAQDTVNVRASVRRATGKITISDIPGGILEPETPNGVIEIDDNEIHIGGALDVFLRAGEPPQRNITLEGILDGSPLHFGLDLESFGNALDQFTQVTEKLSSYGNVVSTNRYGDTVTDHILVQQDDDPETPWKPTEDDVGRYIQLLGGTGSNWGTFEILEFLGEEFYDDSGTLIKAVRLKIDLDNQETGAAAVLTASDAFGVHVRMIDIASLKNRIRDRDASEIAYADIYGPDIPGGADLGDIGTEIGDSAVIETGDDAGIYTIRRILSWLSDNDTLILDRDLTKTVTPSGSGNGTGLRYRIADELNIDLVEPKVTKIPLGNIFSGDDLNTVAGSKEMTVTGDSNFLLAGVEVGDTLEIFSGDNLGTYRIDSFTGTTVVVDAELQATAFSQSYSIYRSFTGADRPLVRVKEVELLDSNAQPTGITIPYGDEVDVRVLGTLANRAEGNIVESFTGQLEVGLGGKLRVLYDANRDFSAEDVVAGHRLNILTGQSIGKYTIQTVSYDGDDNKIAVYAEDPDGGTEFAMAESPIHYSIGLPSSGLARLYFLEPTSVEIQTGLAGGRLETYDVSPKEFRFSEVSGYPVLPAAGSDEEQVRDIRVVRSWETVTPNEFRSILEITDDTRPGVFELEIQEGDVFEINEQVPFRTTQGRKFKDIGIFGTAAGLRTIAGSNLVSVPESSLIDFEAMDNEGDPPLVGQLLIIDSGSDAGTYHIEEVVDSKTLRLDAVMTSTSEAILGEAKIAVKVIAGATGSGNTASGTRSFTDPGHVFTESEVAFGDLLHVKEGVDAGLYPVLRVDGSGVIRIRTEHPTFSGSTGVQYEILKARDAYLTPDTNTLLSDITDGSQLGTQENHYVTLFESARGDLDGTYEIAAITEAGKTVELDFSPDNANDKRTLSGDQDDGVTSTGSSTFSDTDGDFVNDGVAEGDILSINSGTSAGRYLIRSRTATVLTIYPTPPADETSLDYEIEAGKSVDPIGFGRFGWLRTESDVNVGHPFHIYKAVATEAEVTEVATKRADLVDVRRGDITSGTTMIDPAAGWDFTNLPGGGTVEQGDLLEILAGPVAGLYFIASVTSDTISVQSSNPFTVTLSDVAYRIWGGLHGSRRMVTVGPKDSFDGNIEPGEMMPYVVRRPSVFRVSSTDMQENVENSLYYVDVQIESEGAGDEFNLEQDVKLRATRGLRADGYTYTVENQNLAFSAFEEVSLNFDRRFLPVGNSDSPENLSEVSGRNIKIVYETSTTVRIVNDLMRSDAERPVNASPITRHFLPSYVYVTLRYRGGVSATEVGTDIEDYLNNLGAESELEVSDLEAFLTRRGAHSIRHPIILVTVSHGLDRQLVADRSDDRLGGANAVSYEGTGRISSFFATLGEGLIVEKEA